jgi:[ribosomal protein S18]-alanine N-acetyltransferase
MIGLKKIQMNIRVYSWKDKDACLEVFESNCPTYFDQAEYALFENWLLHQDNPRFNYKSPTYLNSEHDSYWLIENDLKRVVGCGGYYICKDPKEARLAWGMIHAKVHGYGYGKALYEFRRNEIQHNWFDHKITLGTSQHTFPFYEKMGMRVIQHIPQGYGVDLDRFDMELS